MKKYEIILTLFILLMPLSMVAQKNEKPIYAFGYATTLADSTVTFSTVQVLPGAQLMPRSGFLEHRSSYANQFRTWLIETYGSYPICVVFFDTSRSSLEKTYVKLRRDVRRKEGMKLRELETNAFLFKAEN